MGRRQYADYSFCRCYLIKEFVDFIDVNNNYLTDYGIPCTVKADTSLLR